MPVSDPIRRLLCRILFCAACVAPTMWVLTQAASPPTPRSWENIIQRALGLKSSIASVETPLPNEIDLNRLSIKLPGAESIDIDAVTIANQGNVKQVRIQSLDAPVDSLFAMLAAVHRNLDMGEFLAREYRLHVAAPIDLQESETTRSSRAPQLHDVSIKLIPGAATWTAELAFRLGEPASEPAGKPAGKSADRPRIVCRLTRHVAPPDQRGGRSETWVLDCESQQLPIRLLTAAFPDLRGLGESATFCGSANLQRQNGEWSGIVTGVIEQIELSQLVGEPLGFVANGAARIELESCSFRQGKLDAMQGRFSCQQGLIGSHLLKALAHYLPLKCPVEQQIANEPTNVEFSNLEFLFGIEQGQLQLAGDALGNSGIVAGNQTPLFQFSNGQPAPVQYLLHALGSAEQNYVPLSLRVLADYLTLPPL